MPVEYGRASLQFCLAAMLETLGHNFGLAFLYSPPFRTDS